MIQRLSYDILWHLTGLLDRKSLFNVVLVNHTLNDIASRQLYSNLVVWFQILSDYNYTVFPQGSLKPQGNSFRIFERRPELRSAVRSVELRSDGSNPFSRSPYKPLITISGCCREMPLLINLRILNVGDLDVPYKCRDLDAIMDAVSTLQHLQLLKYASYPLPEDSPTLQRLSEIEITSEDVDTLRNCSFAKKVVRFATPLRSLTSVDTPLIKGFPNLRDLSLGEYWSSPEELCTALEAVPKLTHLRVKLSVDLNYRYNPKHSYRPTNLTRLSHLTMTFREGYRFMDDDALYWLVESIVGQSSLSSLGIMWYNLKPAKTRCEKLLQHLFARHSRTLQKLKLPFFHMTKTSFQRLAKRMPSLAQLWIGVTPQMMTWLADVICTCTKLERLRLYNLDECGFPFSLSFLQQACPTLRVIKVCQRPNYFIARNTPFLRYAWKSNWVYETPIGSNKRIKGPMKAHQLSAVGRRYNYQDSAYASDSGSDMDFG